MILEISTVRNDDNQRVYVCARDVTGKEREQKIINEKYSMTSKENHFFQGVALWKRLI